MCSRCVAEPAPQGARAVCDEVGSCPTKPRPPKGWHETLIPVQKHILCGTWILRNVRESLVSQGGPSDTKTPAGAKAFFMSLLYIYIPPRIWSPFGINIGHSGEEFWEALKGKNQLLMVVESCGFTLSPKGVLATFAFPVFSVSSPRGSSLGFMRTPPPP